MLAVWGRNDAIFSAAGTEAFRTDAPDERIELLDGGHFLLEAHADEVAALMRDFLAGALTTAQTKGSVKGAAGRGLHAWL